MAGIVMAGWCEGTECRLALSGVGDGVGVGWHGHLKDESKGKERGSLWV